MADGPKLRAVVNGTELDEASARALWARFSAYMEAHPSDTAGFAASEGRRFAVARYLRGAGTAVLEVADEPPPAAPAPRKGRRRPRR